MKQYKQLAEQPETAWAAIGVVQNTCSFLPAALEASTYSIY